MERNRRRGVGRRAALAALAVAAGCGAPPPETTGELAPERRVPLARLVVDNRTDRPLDVSFQVAVGPGGEVQVGRARPGERTAMAPVPAGEPLLLVARAPALERRAGPRTLDIDEVWVWVIDDEPEEDDVRDP